MTPVRRPIILAFIGFAVGLTMNACRPSSTTDIPLTYQPTEPAAETAFAPTPLPPPPKTLIVCIGQEPESLFIYHPDVLYGENSSAAHTILEAIYDGPVELLNYDVQPVILNDLPTLENGGVTIQALTLTENEVYFNPDTLQPANLRMGDRFLPSGCNSPDCLATYSGGDVQMDQMIVEFTLKDGITWSDGQPLTASDSRFSFMLDRSGDLPTTKFLVDRTADYRVVNESTIRWVGIPGYMDSDYKTNFWTPLPEHILGSYPPSELLELEQANRAPIGWGPYTLSAWADGELSMIPNELYERGEEGPQAFDHIIFRFLDEMGDAAIQQILTAECDLVDEALLTQGDYSRARSLGQEGRIAVWSAPDAQLVRLDFNLSPVDRSRPAYFEDVRTRQAVAQCIDRAGIPSILSGISESPPETYINVAHPTFSEDLALVSYDPEAGRELLEQVGWVLDEENPDSPRVAFGVLGVRTATPFNASLLVPETDEMLALGAYVQTQLEDCGLAVELEAMPVDELAQPWPSGPVFGRNFDMVILSWPEWLSPLCEMFASWEIPSNQQPFGINATGYVSSEYDDACMQAFLSVPGMPGHQEALVESQRIFNDDLPALPLYQPERWLVSDKDLCGLRIDALATSSLWNVEMLDSGGSCP